MSNANILERVTALLNRAGHPSTPENEARSCAVLAAKLVYKHEFIVTEKNTTVINDNHDYWKDAVDPKQTENWTEVKTFKTVISKSKGVCRSCKKEYNLGEVVAEVKGSGITHHKCRRFWIDGK